MAEYTSKIIKVINTIPLTTTQQIVVGLVDTDTSNPKSKLSVAVHKYWRKDANSEWNIGKGFHLDSEVAITVANDMLKAANLLNTFL